MKIEHKGLLMPFKSASKKKKSLRRVGQCEPGFRHGKTADRSRGLKCSKRYLSSDSFNYLPKILILSGGQMQRTFLLLRFESV
jgi:hypothetical protein